MKENYCRLMPLVSAAIFFSCGNLKYVHYTLHTTHSNHYVSRESIREQQILSNPRNCTAGLGCIPGGRGHPLGLPQSNALCQQAFPGGCTDLISIGRAVEKRAFCNVPSYLETPLSSREHSHQLTWLITPKKPQCRPLNPCSTKDA